MQFKNSQWVIEIGSGIVILLLTSAALLLAMKHHPVIPQNPSSTIGLTLIGSSTLCGTIA